MKINVVIPCGGSGTRANLNQNKVLQPINDIPMLERTITPFAGLKNVTRIIVPCQPSDMESIAKCLQAIKQLGFAEAMLVKGGATRTESVKNALCSLEDDCDIVVIHDGARPNVKIELIEKCIAAAIKYGSGIAVIPSTDTVAVIKGDDIIKIPDRNDIVNIQTPQAFNKESILTAYSMIGKENYTDDSSVYLKYIANPHYVIGYKSNKKFTYKEDFDPIANAAIGYGFDTHKLVEGRKLILGGVEIPHDKGLLGHSDADVLTHAIMDALLSACGLRDIGVQFPDSDPKYKDADSMELLREVREMMKTKKLVCDSLSAVIIAQKPKLMSYIPLMEKRLARTLGMAAYKVNISATTTEGMGYEGREEAISSRAAVILKSKF